MMQSVLFPPRKDAHVTLATAPVTNLHMNVSIMSTSLHVILKIL